VTTNAPSLAGVFAAAAQASLRAQGLDTEAGAFTPEHAASLLGAAAQYAPAPRKSPAAVRAIRRAHACEHEAAGDAVTPDEVPRARPRAPAWRPVKPWASSRSRRRFAAKVARSANPRFSPRDWCDRTWAGVRVGFCDTGGTRARRMLFELPRALVLRACAAILHEQHARGDLSPGIDWSHITARGIAACAVVLYRESIPTRKRGFARVLVGVSQNMLAALFRNPQGGRTRPGHYHRNSLFASEVHGDKTRGGWVRALERAGFVHIEQPPAEACPPELVGPSGFALGQYWMTERATIEPPPRAVVAWLVEGGAIEPATEPAASSGVPPPS